MAMAISKSYATKAQRHKYYKKNKNFAPLRLSRKNKKTFATLNLCLFATLQQKLIFTKWY
ncbi:hypothetical protein BD847_1275 [Flavobacterium cutihirudinis]|uniref:Uncharacterized protein n=1 Tax=Flavobacterium cutihirudinis TaxID=1265740 RepID=A0A3D9FV12_9FLAO|nr:hypothetical protein BD847_1275 [Flavobacterium cutihirudinis]